VRAVTLYQPNWVHHLGTGQIPLDRDMELSHVTARHLPLVGIGVLDFGDTVPVPFCVCILAGWLRQMCERCSIRVRFDIELFGILRT
jgi:hypothetical protein